EHSSGETSSRGGITRAGNAHVRSALVEAAWHVPMSSRAPKPLAPGQQVSPAVRRHAAKCNRRLQDRREAMEAAGKRPVVANCATAREMACWVWAIAGMATA
ncbi:transposase, partial [Collinsella tanakaei]|uniref:transposase n=1 Tax=Collinsella tanakaei TaxID=626935 RepID=UPI00195E0B9C